MEYQFYGHQEADVPAVTGEYPGIHTPRDLYDVLTGVWCEYTCAPRMRDEWSTANRTLGQCSITAFLVQDIFGGKVRGILRPGGNYHCYNEVDGHVFDLTSEQFGDEELCYENDPEQFREVHFAKEEKRQRYEFLRKALLRACGIMPDYRSLFFDLDGTLVQSEFGIIDSIIYALKKFGIEETDRESLKRFIGPALYESFQKYYHFGPEDADLAVKYYREAYEREGIYRAPVYEGIPEMLETLRSAGKKLYVVTAKPQEMAEKVLLHTGIAGYFESVVGPDRGARHTDKASLIRRVLGILTQAETEREQMLTENTAGKNAVGAEAQTAAENAAAHALMVGDRHYDMEGAVQTGVDGMGVLYGYGNRQELTRAGAAWIAKTPEEAAALILRGQ